MTSHDFCVGMAILTCPLRQKVEMPAIHQVTKSGLQIKMWKATFGGTRLGEVTWGTENLENSRGSRKELWSTLTFKEQVADILLFGCDKTTNNIYLKPMIKYIITGV